MGVLGGANIAASFMAQDLIDEYRISVHPVIVGAGTPLFGPSTVRDTVVIVTSGGKNRPTRWSR